MDLRLTKERMRMFWEYGKGRVFIAIVAAIALFYTLYQLTRPVVPAAQRFDILQGGVYVEEGIQAWSQALLDGVTVNQTQINIEGLTLDEYDASDAQMVMASRMTGQDGDLFIIPYTVYQALAKSDNLVNLEDPIPGDPEGRSVLDRLELPEAIEPERCRITVTTTDARGSEVSTREICGIDASNIYGLLEIGVVPTDYVICIPDYRELDYENIVRVIQWMVDEKLDYEEPATQTTAAEQNQ